LTHLLLINVATPASSSVFISKLMDLLAFQFWDMSPILDSVLSLDDDDYPLTDQFETLGYESLYFLKNLGTVSLGIVIPLTLWFIIYTVIGFFIPRYERAK
jgi:hypothetical protein